MDGEWRPRPAHLVVIVGVFLLVGVGSAMTTAVALVAFAGDTTVNTDVAAAVAAAPFLLGPALAGLLSAATARGAPNPVAAALGGGVGSLVGFYLLAALTLGALVAVTRSADGVAAFAASSFLQPVLVAGLPAAVVGAASGYLGAAVGGSADREPGGSTGRSDSTGGVNDLFEDTGRSDATEER